MRWINNKIQGDFMHRRGLRGRWITIYLHKYGGKPEETERYHSHPWRWTFGLLLWGWMQEARGGLGAKLRRAPSIAAYHRSDEHRVIAAKGWSLFVGIGRSQEGHRCYGCHLMDTFSSFGHYTELTKREWPHQGPGGKPLVECLS